MERGWREGLYGERRGCDMDWKGSGAQNRELGTLGQQGERKVSIQGGSGALWGTRGFPTEKAQEPQGSSRTGNGSSGLSWPVPARSWSRDVPSQLCPPLPPSPQLSWPCSPCQKQVLGQTGMYQPGGGAGHDRNNQTSRNRLTVKVSLQAHPSYQV